MALNFVVPTKHITDDEIVTNLDKGLTLQCPVMLTFTNTFWIVSVREELSCNKDGNGASVLGYLPFL